MNTSGIALRRLYGTEFREVNGTRLYRAPEYAVVDTPASR